MDLSFMLNNLANNIGADEVRKLLNISKYVFENIKKNQSQKVSYEIGKRIEKLYFAYFGDGYIGVQKLFKDIE